MRIMRTMLTIAAATLLLATGAHAFDPGAEQERIDNALHSKLDAAADAFDKAIARSEDILNNAYARHLSDAALNAAHEAHFRRIEAAQARYDRVYYPALAEWERAMAALERRMLRWDEQQAEKARLKEEARIREELERPERERQAVIAAQKERERRAANEPGKLRRFNITPNTIDISIKPEGDNLVVGRRADTGPAFPSQFVTVPAKGYKVDERFGSGSRDIADISSISDGGSYMSWGHWAIVLDLSEWPGRDGQRTIYETHSFLAGNHPAHNVGPVLGTAKYHGSASGNVEIGLTDSSGAIPVIKEWGNTFSGQYVLLHADFDENTIRGWTAIQLDKKGWINKSYGGLRRPAWSDHGLNEISFFETPINPDGTFEGRGHARPVFGKYVHDVRWVGGFHLPDDDPTKAPKAAGAIFHGSSNHRIDSDTKIRVRVVGAFGAGRE